MTSSITFETATITDAIKKAVKIAPTRGAAFDKANGILLDFNPTTFSAMPLGVLRSTNLDIFSMEWVTALDMSGEPARWRFPHALLGQVLSTLPIGTDKTVTFTSEATSHGFHINLKADRVKAKFIPLSADDYPDWGAFDPDHMFPATDLGGRIDMVEWAASKSQPEISGVYLDGKIAAATDTYRLACVPLSIPDLVEPIVVPSGLLGQTLRATGDISIGVSGNFLNIMPDQYTQMRSIVMRTKFPNISRVMDQELADKVELNRDQLLELMSRVNAFSLGDRTAAFQVFIGREQVVVGMQNESAGTIRDSLEVPGQALHDRMELKFTPKNIMEALQKAPNKDIELWYNAGATKTVVRIDGGSGYKCWAMPRVGSSEASE